MEKDTADAIALLSEKMEKSFEKIENNFNFLDKSFVGLRTLTEEKWRAHDVASAERARESNEWRTRFEKKLDNTILELANKPCDTRETEIESLSKSTDHRFGLVQWGFGLVTVTITGIFMYLLKAGN